MRLSHLLFATVVTTSALFSADAPKVVVRDPILVGKAWAISENTLQFNERYDKKGKWSVKFDRHRFTQLTGAAGIGLTLKRIVPSTKDQGRATLLAESGGSTYVFETDDLGENWRVVKAPDSPRAEASKPSGEAVDLGALNATPSSSHGGAPSSHLSATNAAPMFKILFDLLLHLRPGVSSWTFDNYHGLFLVDFMPKPEIQFSFEVNPSPRYYEFDYQISKAWQLRLGRIWIPFDDMNPHNTFGGLINTSKMRDSRAAAFLPDIWADLGVGAKWKPIDTTSLTLTAHLYVVNGFQAGGTDPTGQVTAYPNFGGATGIDNNTDKSVGARVHFLLNQTFGIGTSFYTGRYTDQGDEAKRLSLFGVDGSVRLTTGTTLKGGYTYQKVELPSSAGKPDYLRGGAYVEAHQRIQKNYIVGGRFGVQQGDDRVTDLNDQTWATGRVGYETDIWQLYLIYARDLNDTPDKAYKEYTAGRFVVTL